MMKSICELYVMCGMYVESCTILVVVNRLSRPVMVLDGLPGLYGFKYDSATACGLPLYLYSYKLVGSATCAIKERWFAPHMVEHNLSHNLTPRLLSLYTNGDHGSDTT